MSNAQSAKPKQTKRAKKNVTTVTNVLSKPQTMVYKVPHCAEHYFDCLIDPFSTETGVCIPCDLFPMPSGKVKVWKRGTFALGTTGHGYLMLSIPFANDVVFLSTTTSTSVGTNITPFDSFTNLQNGVFSALPYNSATVGSGGTVQSRVVGFGARIKYVGKLMDQQGMIFALEEPDHNDVGNLNIDNVSAFQYTRADRVGQMKDWDSTICYSGPTDPNHLDYQKQTIFLSGQRPFVFAVSGGPGDKYEYELVLHTEMIGNPVPNRTPSHADAHAFGKVVETVKNASASQPIQPSMIRPLWDRFKTSIVEGLPKLASGAVQVVSSAFSGDLSKLLTGSQDLYKGVSPAVRALLETPAERGMQSVGRSPYLALPAPRLVVK